MTPRVRYFKSALAASALSLTLTLIMAACVSTAMAPPDPKVAKDRERDGNVVTGLRVKQESAPIERTQQALDLPKADISAAAPAAAVGGSGAYYPLGARIARHALSTYEQNTENYKHFDDNPIHLAAEDPVSTFSVDVDTGAYANVRRLIGEGALPPEDAVRTEELVNYFSYTYPVPEDRKQPFSVYTEVAPTPWNADSLLLHIGIKGYEVSMRERPAANLVFLIDVSGSMASPDKLDLLKPALGLMAKQLTAKDRVSIVVYAGNTGLVLAPTPGDRRGEIRAAIDNLEAGGSTNGGDGIRLAYQMARQAFIKGGINRVLLATDGDFNVGTVNIEQLKDLVKRERDSGIQLTTLGFGTGNYNDALMEQMADVGNGNYAYIDSLKEANKVLVEQAANTLLVIAGDVKAQLEFNPALVAEYRLIGYENRVLRRDDFNNDKVDAGDIGAGHTVTALYEITLVGHGTPKVDPLRYEITGKLPVPPAKVEPMPMQELAFLKLRYKRPGESESQLISRPIHWGQVKASGATSEDFRFAAAVAAFGQRLRGAEQLDGFDYEAIAKLAAGSRGADPRGERGEFLGLVRTAAALVPEVAAQAAR